jgi:hypothetical protein
MLPFAAAVAGETARAAATTEKRIFTGKSITKSKGAVIYVKGVQ